MTTPEAPDSSIDSNALSLDSDLAERARLLDARSEELDRFARMASHDLRAPLRSIEAFTRLAMESEDFDEVAEHLDRVVNAVTRMRLLLDSLLEFADADRAVAERSEVSLEEVVHAAVADLAVDFEESDAEIDIGRLPSVRCDPTQLRRVFANLFSNSIRYSTERKPRIVVLAEDEPERVVITVVDEGDGFAAELAEEVFEPFRRLTTNSSGQGIGLAICRRIVEHHGGEMWAESEPGNGTKITLTLAKRFESAT